ncbi:hypothetical protein [Nocardioides sp. SYSU D00065]|uniref:hypothetical protein n=1 Tax=Nocardioides sp. SYSU D00065 TaxID=2817378 RepID=UPI001B33CF96|nr:hypothetical protein [Nocardioides sp. SYSU D00065]
MPSGMRSGMRFGRPVWLAAAAAFVARFPSLLWPLRPDEAGFLLVARTWQPEPGSVYGHHWVDRPPLVIWLVRAADALGGPYAHRLVGAFACALLVLAAAGAAGEVARRARLTDPAGAQRVAGWAAALTAALVGNAWIDPAAAKGELFGIPLVLASCWLALRAVRRTSAPDAFWAGLLAMTALGLKQSIVGGLVFGAVLLAATLLTRELPARAGLRCAAAATAGAAVPVAAVVGWALAAGVRLPTLWYTVVTFRFDASRTIAAQSGGAPTDRAWLLLLLFLGVGMLFVLVCFATRLRALLRHDAALVAAIAAVLVVDVVGIVVSGSYWKPYLLVPIPGLALAVAALLTLDQVHPPRRPTTPAAVIFAVASSVVALVTWTAAWAAGRVPVEVRTGEAIAAAAGPGDRVLVYGGRADIQWASGAPSPYAHLWSLPMRTLDPRLSQLRKVLTGDGAPTWFVEATRLDAWSERGTRRLERSLIRDYDLVTEACDRYRVYRLRAAGPARLDVDCSTPFRTIWGR